MCFIFFDNLLQVFLIVNKVNKVVSSANLLGALIHNNLYRIVAVAVLLNILHHCFVNCCSIYTGVKPSTILKALLSGKHIIFS